MRDVPDVAIAAVDFLGRLRDWNIVLGGVIERVLARNDGPFTPRRNHGKVRGQRFVSQLEADLIVPFARAPMRERVTPCTKRNFNLFLGQQRTRNRCSQQVLVFVDPAGTHKPPQVFGDELLAQIFDIDFRSAGLPCFRLETGQFLIPLADIAAHRDHITVIVFLQPGNDD